MAAARCSCSRDTLQLRMLADDARRAAPFGEFFLQQQVLGEQAPLRDRTFDHQQQMLRIDRLRQEVHRPFLHCRHGVLNAGIGRHDDHLQLGIDLLCRAQHAEAIPRGQLQVGQHDGGAIRLQLARASVSSRASSTA